MNNEIFSLSSFVFKPFRFIMIPPYNWHENLSIKRGRYESWKQGTTILSLFSVSPSLLFNIKIIFFAINTSNYLTHTNKSINSAIYDSVCLCLWECESVRGAIHLLDQKNEIEKKSEKHFDICVCSTLSYTTTTLISAKKSDTSHLLLTWGPFFYKWEI